MPGRPAADDGHARVTVAGQAGARDDRVHAGPRPILVVDDDPKIVALVRTYLERERYPVVTAGDGRTALRLIDEGARGSWSSTR